MAKKEVIKSVYVAAISVFIALGALSLQAAYHENYLSLIPIGWVIWFYAVCVITSNACFIAFKVKEHIKRHLRVAGSRRKAKRTSWYINEWSEGSLKSTEKPRLSVRTFFCSSLFVMIFVLLAGSFLLKLYVFVAEPFTEPKFIPIASAGFEYSSSPRLGQCRYKVDLYNESKYWQNTCVTKVLYSSLQAGEDRIPVKKTLVGYVVVGYEDAP